MMNQLFWWKIKKFYGKIPKFIKTLMIILLTLQMNLLFITGDAFYYLELTSRMSVLNNYASI